MHEVIQSEAPQHSCCLTCTSHCRNLDAATKTLKSVLISAVFPPHRPQDRKSLHFLFRCDPLQGWGGSFVEKGEEFICLGGSEKTMTGRATKGAS